MNIVHTDVSKEMKQTIKALSLVRSGFRKTLLGMSMKRKQKFSMPSRKIRKQIRVNKRKIQGTNILEFGSGDNYVYLHGGAYRLKVGQNHYKFIRDFCLTKKAKITYIDYPVGCSYKETILKTEAVLNELHYVGIIGDSAGGGLALSVNTEVPLFLFSPWLDLSMSNKDIDDSNEFMFLKQELLECAKIYADDLKLDDPIISPLYKAPDTRVTIYAGTNDILYHDIKLYEERYPDVVLNSYEGLPHVFPILAGTQESMDVIQDIKL